MGKKNTLSRPIVLGVGGAMYTDTRACLLHLGVELPRVEKIMRKLNLHTTQAVSSILHARRGLYHPVTIRAQIK